MSILTVLLGVLIYIAVVLAIARICGVNDDRSRVQDSPPPQCPADNRFALRRTPRTLDRLRRW